MDGDFNATYTWNDGNVYVLHYTQQDDGRFRIEILAQPDYGSRDTSVRIIGRQEEDGRFFIDTDETYPRKPSTFRQAELVAANWMTHTDKYIKAGVPLPLYDDELPPGCILWLG